MVAVDAFKTDVFIITTFKLFIIPLEAFKTEVFVTPACKASIIAMETFKTETLVVIDSNALFIKELTQAVVGIFVELSKLDKTEDILG